MNQRIEVTGDAVPAGVHASGLNPNDGRPGNPNSDSTRVHPGPAPERDVGKPDQAPGSDKASTTTVTDAEREQGSGTRPGEPA